MDKTQPLNAYDIIVVGGGASGMMAAATAAKQGARVLLLEKNKRLGAKLSISGGGRCNITNAEDDVRTLLSNYGDSAKFLFSSFSRFGMQDTIDYFEGLGLPIKVEGRKRAFPRSDSAQDVVDTLAKDMRGSGVAIRLDSTVSSLHFDQQRFAHVTVNNEKILAGSLILATGGTSRPETGSTGDGFQWLAGSGHTISKPTPNITPLSATDEWIKEAQGVKVIGASVHFIQNGNRNFTAKGDVLITHFGISGPTILNSAHRVSGLLQSGTVSAEIDTHPHLTEKQLDTQIEQTMKENPAKDMKNILKSVSPPGLSGALSALLSGLVDLNKNCSEQSRESRLAIVSLLKALPLTIDKLMGFEWAVVADGGLNLTDLDTRTMRSTKIDNLYITGDLLDINRPSGGFSLQLCWTSGYIAGLNAATSK